jgi:hypothetical protein
MELFLEGHDRLADTEGLASACVSADMVASVVPPTSYATDSNYRHACQHPRKCLETPRSRNQTVSSPVAHHFEFAASPGLGSFHWKDGFQ